MFSLSDIRELLRSHDGVLTEELRQNSSQLGLGQLPKHRQPDALTTMVCGYCSTGCSLVIHMKDGQAISLSPDGRYPVNRGMACPKGWEALRVLDSPERAVVPLRRNDDGGWSEVSWEYAILTFVSRMKAIQEKHGKGSVAFLGTGQIPTEELAFLGALAKFGMGFQHGDGNTRQCMASAVVAYKQSFGFDAPPYTYQDLEESDTIVLVGSNLCIAHPILWERIFFWLCRTCMQPVKRRSLPTLFCRRPAGERRRELSSTLSGASDGCAAFPKLRAKPWRIFIFSV